MENQNLIRGNLFYPHSVELFKKILETGDKDKISEVLNMNLYADDGENYLTLVKYANVSSEEPKVKENIEIFKKEKEYNPSINNHYCSILYHAFEAKEFELIKQMLEIGIHYKIVESSNQNYLFCSIGDYRYVYSENPEIIEDYETIKDPKELQYREKDIELLYLMLKKGAGWDVEIDPGMRDYEFKNTPLHALISNEDDIRALNLIEAAVRFNKDSERTNPPLTFDKRDIQGKTPLHIAALVGFESVIAALVGINADPKFINAQDNLGRTALHIACARGNVKLVETLLKAGARLDISDINGLLPIDYAGNNRKKVVEILSSVNIDPGRRYDAIGDFPTKIIKEEDTLATHCCNGHGEVRLHLIKHQAKNLNPDLGEDRVIVSQKSLDIVTHHLQRQSERLPNIGPAGFLK